MSRKIYTNLISASDRSIFHAMVKVPICLPFLLIHSYLHSQS